MTKSEKVRKSEEKVRKSERKVTKSEKKGEKREKSDWQRLLFFAPYPGEIFNVKLYSTSRKCLDINNISTGGNISLL